MLQLGADTDHFNLLLRTGNVAISKAVGKLRSLQKLSDKIASFFRNPDCRYTLAAQCLYIL